MELLRKTKITELSPMCIFQIIIKFNLTIHVAELTSGCAYLEHRVVEERTLVTHLVDDALVLGRIVAEYELLHGIGVVRRAARSKHGACVARLLVRVAVADLNGAHAHVRCGRTIDCVGDFGIERVLVTIAVARVRAARIAAERFDRARLIDEQIRTRYAECQ